MSDQQGTTGNGWLRSGNRKLIVLVTGAAIVLGGVWGVQAFADSKGYEHLRLSAGYSGGWHGGDHKGFAELSDAEIEARIERVVKHVAIEIDATPEQQEKITALAAAVAKDLKPMKGRMHATGEALHNLLLADRVDRAALEQLRAERLADAERISKTLVGALADVAEVLSPEQRKVLDERISEFRSMRRGWHRG